MVKHKELEGGHQLVKIKQFGNDFDEESVNFFK